MSQVHPDINRGVWSAPEDALLKRLAEATEGQDWDSIARWLQGCGVLCRAMSQCRVVNPYMQGAGDQQDASRLLRQVHDKAQRGREQQVLHQVYNEPHFTNDMLLCYRVISVHSRPLTALARKWERAEDDRLRRLVAHCRINDFIPWVKVPLPPFHYCTIASIYHYTITPSHHCTITPYHHFTR